MSQDPSLDPVYASQLKQQCPQGSTNPNLVVPMDLSSLGTIDAGYYTNILANRGLFTSDQTLLTNAATAIQVNQNAMNTELWRSKFASTMLKMGQLDVLTGNAGEIRSNCREIVPVYQDTIHGQNPFYGQGSSPILSVRIKYITYIVSLLNLVNVWLV